MKAKLLRLLLVLMLSCSLLTACGEWGEGENEREGDNPGLVAPGEGGEDNEGGSGDY
ncbi:hypothetical protein [Kallotenue papyrolyticum]|uniref:hypothetical protein n=1 Tax=Kallotenue papyrolyticum TaxID=1325125 RepID=UPI0004AF8174|nr:hypothetical protein [Kallotenue papyrolyticum]